MTCRIGGSSDETGVERLLCTSDSFVVFNSFETVNPAFRNELRGEVNIGDFLGNPFVKEWR